MRRFLSYSAVVATALLAPQLVSAQACTAMPQTLPAYLNCAGSFGGNINGSAGELAQLTTAFGGVWTYSGKSDDLVPSNGPFTSNPNGATTNFTLSFDAPVTGIFVVGLKASNNYSFYRFNGGVTGVTSITGFSTAGTAVNQNDVLQGLSHAALYRTTSTSVPEPSTYLLMASGLVAVGFVARRRKA